MKCGKLKAEIGRRHRPAWRREIRSPKAEVRIPPSLRLRLDKGGMGGFGQVGDSGERTLGEKLKLEGVAGRFGDAALGEVRFG
jgi:hypothetical protein